LFIKTGECSIAATKLIISGPVDTREVLLEPKGATLGREHNCDIVLEHNSISRLHARIFQDPFDRWIIEDMQSHNGVLVEGKRIKAQAVLPNQKISIPPFTLTLSQEFEQKAVPDSPIQNSISVVDKGLEEEVVSYQAGTDRILSAALLKCLNEISGDLLQMNNSSELYSQASLCLANMLNALVAFVRLPCSSEPLPNSPQMLACHFGTYAIRDDVTQTSNIHLSKRVLDAVRSTNAPVMARSGPSSDKELVLTVVDEVTPHVVFSAPINEFGGKVDALYLDILEDRMPQEMFDFVEAVARQISSVQKSLINSEAKAEMMVLERQLTLARDIQSKLNPDKLERRFEVDIAAAYKPAMWVGGDYYDVWTLEDGRIAFAVGDVSGKGLPAAMIMSNLQAALRTTMSFCTELSTIAEHINRHLCQNLRDDMFVTFFLGLFDLSTDKLSYVNAGHILPLIVPPSEPAKPLGQSANIPLGIFEGPFETATEIIHPGTSLLVVTDGITEASSPDDEQFEMERLQKLVTDSEADSAQELVNLVVKCVTDFRQQLPQQDDITVIALINQKADSEKED